MCSYSTITRPFILVLALISSVSVSLALAVKRTPQIVHESLQHDLATGVGVAHITIGNSSQQIKMLLDTGSAATWIKPSAIPADVDVGKPLGPFSAEYAAGTTKGTKHKATITVAGKLVLNEFTFGVAEPDEEDPWDGIMGLGDRNVDDPTVLQEMAKAGIIDKRIGFFFRPLGIPNRGNNDVTWGGIDEDFEGKLTYTNLIGPGDARTYNNLGIDSVTLSMNGKIIAQGPALLDSASINIELKPSAYKAYLETTHAATSKEFEQHIEVPQDDYKQLGDLRVTIGGKHFDMNPSAQKWAEVMSGSTAAFMRVGKLEEEHPYEILLGMPFFERFYVDINLAEEKCGMGKTKFTDSQAI